MPALGAGHAEHDAPGFGHICTHAGTWDMDTWCSSCRLANTVRSLLVLDAQRATRMCVRVHVVLQSMCIVPSAQGSLMGLAAQFMQCNPRAMQRVSSSSSITVQPQLQLGLQLVRAVYSNDIWCGHWLIPAGPPWTAHECSDATAMRSHMQMTASCNGNQSPLKRLQPQLSTCIHAQFVDENLLPHSQPPTPSLLIAGCSGLSTDQQPYNVAAVCMGVHTPCTSNHNTRITRVKVPAAALYSAGGS